MLIYDVLPFSLTITSIIQIPIQLFDFTSELAIGNAPSLKSAVENHLYPPAFTYRVVQNEPGRDCKPKKRCVHLNLWPTQPAVKIPVDVIDYGENCTILYMCLLYLCVIVRLGDIVNTC